MAGRTLGQKPRQQTAKKDPDLGVGPKVKRSPEPGMVQGGPEQGPLRPRAIIKALSLSRISPATQASEHRSQHSELRPLAHRGAGKRWRGPGAGKLFMESHDRKPERASGLSRPAQQFGFRPAGGPQPLDLHLPALVFASPSPPPPSPPSPATVSPAHSQGS